MTNILKFAKRTRSSDQDRPKAVISIAMPTVKTPDILAAVHKGVWPILKWMISLDCALQLVRMIYHWGHRAFMPAGNFFFTLPC